MSDGIILRDEVRPPEPAGDQLMRGLVFIRANTMHMIRLQLAMERGDRRLALQTMDELVALDTKIRDLVESGAAGAEISRMQRELDQQRLTLSLEKLALAAGVQSRPRAWNEPARTAAPDDVAPDRPAAIDALAADSDAPALAGIDDVHGLAHPVTEARAPTGRRLRMIGFAALLVAFGAAILGAIFHGAAAPLLADWLSKGSAAWPM